MHYIELDGVLINLDLVRHIEPLGETKSVFYFDKDNYKVIDIPYSALRDHILSWQRREAR